MKTRNKRDPLPDAFPTEAAAGEFWDTHSTMDYSGYLEPVDDVLEITKRTFVVQIAEDVFHRLEQEASSSQQSVPQVVDHILRETLAARS